MAITSLNMITTHLFLSENQLINIAPHLSYLPAHVIKKIDLSVVHPIKIGKKLQKADTAS